MTEQTRSRHALASISLRQLRAFILVADEGSLTRAADRLHLTPSALSMLIRGLETELGVRLFDRTTRKMTLTPGGRSLLPAVRAVFAELDQAIEAVRQQEAERSGRLTIATSPMLAATWPPERIAAFAERYPAVSVGLLDLPVAEVTRAVRGGQADCGLCTLDAATDLGGLNSRTIYQDRLMACCPPSHAFADRRELRWHDLAGQPLIVLRHGSGLRTLVEQVFATMGEPLMPHAEVAQVTTAIGMVQAGLGIALLPNLAVSHRWAQGVRGVALVDPIVTRDIVWLSPRDRQAPVMAESFVESFVSALQGS